MYGWWEMEHWQPTTKAQHASTYTVSDRSRCRRNCQPAFGVDADQWGRRFTSEGNNKCLRLRVTLQCRVTPNIDRSWAVQHPIAWRGLSNRQALLCRSCTFNLMRYNLDQNIRDISSSPCIQVQNTTSLPSSLHILLYHKRRYSWTKIVVTAQPHPLLLIMLRYHQLVYAKWYKSNSRLVLDSYPCHYLDAPARLPLPRRLTRAVSTFRALMLWTKAAWTTRLEAAWR